MSSSAITASLQVDLVPGEGPGLQLEYAGIDDGLSTSAAIKLRLYPDVPALVRATAGTVTLGESRRRPILHEILKFTGTTRVSPRYPIASDFAYHSLAVAFDKQGNPVEPVLSYDPGANEVVSDIAFYGGVWITYQTGYRILDYTPTVETAETASSVGAVAVGTGTVLAYYAGKVATMDVELSFAEDNYKYVELYRVTSDIVLDPEGAWEEPPGWPDNVGTPAYPISNAAGPDPDNSFTDARPHEIARINPLAQIDFAAYYHPWLKPYTGFQTYHPKYKLVKASVPNDPDAGQSKDEHGFYRQTGNRYQKAFASVDWARIMRRLDFLYPGIAA